MEFNEETEEQTIETSVYEYGISISTEDYQSIELKARNASSGESLNKIKRAEQEHFYFI
ncbi:MAG: hypothetical protein LBS81_04705 [Endomicrobium sp.]|jgi:hypothetical protein|nr:hypothetical protein [Endomicrobium sp.]